MTALDVATAYLDALVARDAGRAAALLAPHIVITIPYSLSGGPEPMYVFSGREAATAYVGQIVGGFSQVHLTERATYAVDDASTVFVEARGDLVQRGTEAIYRNTYVFKLQIRDGLIERISEYANPVAYGKLMGLLAG